LLIGRAVWRSLAFSVFALVAVFFSAGTLIWLIAVLIGVFAFLVVFLAVVFRLAAVAFSGFGIILGIVF
jgi:beta-lactamase regulating signal transducer with metallopeptidase domain